MVQLVLGITMAVISANTAQQKGYNPIIWFLAGSGLLGVLVINFLPNMEKYIELPEDEREAKRKRGNWIGGVIAVLVVFIIIYALTNFYTF